MKCLNTVVYYDNKEEVEKYIKEVYEIAGGMADIALVVNRNDKEQLSSMVEELQQSGINCVRVYNYRENVGYLNAMLKTINNINTDAYDYVILSNTDIHYEDRKFFTKLAKSNYPQNFGCIAPSVYATSSKSYSNPHYMKRIPKEKLERLAWIFTHPKLGRLYLRVAELKAGKAKAEKKTSCFVYSPHGCYMIFTREFIKHLNGYEYGARMYSEESCVGELLLKYGLKCYYDASIEVQHQESSVTGKINYKRRFEDWKKSLEYILREFY